MSQNQNQNLFAFQSDTDEKLVSAGNGGKVFGLNQGITVESVEYRAENQAGEKSPSISLELKTAEGGKLFYNIYSNVTIYDKDSKPRTDTGSADYQAKYAKEFAQTRAVLTHFCTKAVPEARYKELYDKAGIDSVEKLFKFSAEGMKALQAKQIPFDAFLQYQRKPKGDNTITFLELPPNLKFGPFLAADTSGTKWEEVLEEGKLKYKNAAGEYHLFTRDKKFLDSAVAKEQTKEGSTDFSAAASAMNAGTASTSTDTSWM